MIRRVLLFTITALVISSCGNAVKKDGSKAEGTENATKVEFASLVSNPDNYVGKNIIVEGKVVHVCTESGKKLFIVGDDPNIRLFILAGENMPKFSMDLLGSQVSVEGLIKKTSLMASAESLQKPDESEKPMSSDSCKTETALAAQPSLAGIVMEYKSHIVK